MQTHNHFPSKTWRHLPVITAATFHLLPAAIFLRQLFASLIGAKPVAECFGGLARFNHLLVAGAILVLAVSGTAQAASSISGHILYLGRVPVSGVTITGSRKGLLISTTSDSTGFYLLNIPGFNGTIAIVPSKTGYTFDPPSTNLAFSAFTSQNVTVDFTTPDFIITPGCEPGFPDNFACRTLLTGTNISFSGTNIGATVEPDEPSHFIYNLVLPLFEEADASLWYSWTAPFSGGVVITADASFAPILAVYTGDSFATFTPVASNLTFTAESRLCFNAVAGTTYQLAVDGAITTGSSSGQGSFNLNLALTPPPTNDLFANSTPISGPLFETSGSVVGATRETGEPAHTNSGDFPAWPQTLWWSWTAPNNLGVSAIPVKLIAEGVTFNPGIGVYTGTSIANLTNVPLTAQVDNTGNTSIANFTAVPGATYQIALGGTEDFPAAASPGLADYYLRLNIRALVLSFASITSTQNVDFSLSFDADLQVTNYGSASSSALRVQVTGILTGSFDQNAGFTPLGQVLLLTTNLPALDPGQGLVQHITGVVPPPSSINSNFVAYAAYAELQEQVGTNWFTLDQTFLADEALTTLNGGAGTGGGVITIDPGLTAAGFNPLTGVNVLGPTTIPEGSTAAYFGRARYASGDQFDFSNTVWTATLFSITNGLFTTGSVTSNTPVTLDAKYASDAFTYDTPTNILILNLPPPTLANLLRLPDRNFQLSLQGVPGRQHVIEAATNLNAPVTWTSLMTNAAGQDGSLIFTDSTATNFSRRFYRAREN